MTITNDMAFDAYVQILNKVNTGVYFTDHNRHILFWNEEAENITGFRADEVMGKSCRDNILVHVDQEGRSLCCSKRCPLLKSMKECVELQADVILHHKAGHRVPVHVKTMPLYDGHGKSIGGVEIFSALHFDNVDLQRLYELEAQALLDHLTGLSNRRYMTEILDKRFQQQGPVDMPFHLMLLDIDHFKQVNDNFGHTMGDKVLKMVADSIIHSIPARDIAARWGGEEFLILFDEADSSDALHHGEQVLNAIRHSFLMDENQKISVTASAGLVSSADFNNYADAMEEVDRYLYTSKDLGRDRLSHAVNIID